MNVTFPCPACREAGRVDITSGSEHFECPACRRQIDVPTDAWQDGRLNRCLACPSTELFIRKDFPQQVGVGIVVVGFLASCIAWYFHLVLATFAILFATAAIDVLLYLVIGEALNCYRCGATYRHLEDLENHAPFDLEVFEKYRQQSARLNESSTVQ